jgi:paraquat-inducible protein B
MDNNMQTADVVRLPTKKVSLTWIVPLIAIVITLFLFLQWKLHQGPQITITFEDANGITTESPIIFRGTVVGRIESITLNDTAMQVVVQARLDSSAEILAKEHSKWWIVRPTVSLQGIQGLDTIVGPRYITVMPGDGKEQFAFVGSSEAVPTNSKRFTLVTTSADNISLGAPIFYRGIEVGDITSINLANDATTVRLECSILGQYAPLVRTNSKFWNVSGIHIDANLLGIDLRAGPITSWIKGGISFATPSRVGDIAPDGYAFALERDVDDDWLEWAPVIDLDTEQE